MLINNGKDKYGSSPANAGSWLQLHLGMVYLNILYFLHCYPAVGCVLSI